MTIAVRPARAATSASCTAASDCGVEVGGRLVEDHDPWLGEQQAGDRQPLALAARQPVAALADDGVEAVGQRPHQRAEAGLVERRPQLVVGRPPGAA